VEVVGRKKSRAGGNRVTLTRIARELGVSAMTVSNAYNHPDRLSEALRERILETAGRLGYQGSRSHGAFVEEPLLAAALERRLPAVVVDQPRKEGVPIVGIDDEGAARTAAEHLLDLGHERFAIVSFGLSPDGHEGIADSYRQERTAFYVSRMRLQGYRAALEEAGLLWSGVSVYECQGSAKELGYRAVEALFCSQQEPTAILASSDQLALGAIEWMTERRISVPQDVSVVGFDDIPAAESADPPLTTVHQAHVEKGIMAGRMLVAQIHEEGAPNAGPLATHLVVRGSTSPNRER
jgi:DNA-binding LacI/PurR family transcriptional regulator